MTETALTVVRLIAAAIGALLCVVAFTAATRANQLEVAVAVFGGAVAGAAMFGGRR